MATDGGHASGVETEKAVNPRGHILNDNDIGVDYLGHTVYAEALAETIVNVKTPVTIGVFARWGSGKSFLVKHVCSLLEKRQRQASASVAEIRRPQGRTRCCCTSFLLVILVICLIILAIAAAAPEFVYKHIQNVSDFVLDEPTEKLMENSTVSNSTGQPERIKQSVQTIGIGSLVGLTIIVLLVCLVMCCGQDSSCWPSFKGNFKLIAFVAFTKLPIAHADKTFVQVDDDDVHLKFDPKREMEAEQIPPNVSKRYVFVKFSAWEYAGSDNLWAGIATNLSDAIESEFGSVVSRLFRIFDLDEISPDDEVANPNDNILFARFGSTKNRDQIETVAKEYGAVCSVVKYVEWKKAQGKKNKLNADQLPNWWVVEYTDFREARIAQKFLKRAGILVQFTEPQTANRDNQDVIEMEEMAMNDEARSLVSEKEADSRAKVITFRGGFWRHFFRYPKKKCKLPVLYWFVMLILSAVVLPIITYLVAKHLSLTVFKSPRAVPVAVQIFAWLPGITGSVYVLLKFVWAMLHSQRSRIKSALESTKDKMSSALGLMDKVKHEVHVITKLVHCAEFTHKRKYTVVITIDDLDRVPQDKVKSVLEAVSILLSDGSSPFVCLIALDSRVAVKCIEEGMGKALLNANVNGHEYLKKIINLPFCLPEVGNDNKKRFIEGLIDQTDKTNTLIKHTAGNNTVHTAIHDNHVNHFDRNGNNRLKETTLTDTGDVTDGFDNNHAGRFSNNVPTSSTVKRDFRSGFVGKQFLYDCREFLQTDPLVRKHLLGNPRNIKRIYNVLSLNSVIVNCTKREIERKTILQSLGQANFRAHGGTETDTTFQNTQTHHQQALIATTNASTLASDIVRWIVLTDQWPYRMSYILQVIDDADQRHQAGRQGEEISDDESLFDIYKSRVCKEIMESSDENKSLLSLDADPDVFFSFIKQLEAVGMTKGRAKQLNKYTVNLDHSLRQPISHQRSLADIGGKSTDQTLRNNEDLGDEEELETPRQMESKPATTQTALPVQQNVQNNVGLAPQPCAAISSVFANSENSRQPVSSVLPKHERHLAVNVGEKINGSTSPPRNHIVPSETNENYVQRW